jgi:hypothetical protein
LGLELGLVGVRVGVRVEVRVGASTSTIKARSYLPRVYEMKSSCSKL